MTITAILISPERIGTIHLDARKTGESISAAIGCDHFDVVQLGDGLDVFVDDEGAINGSPLNLILTILAHQLGVPAVLFGSAVIVGFDPQDGSTISLTTAQQTQVAELLHRRPDPATLDRLCESLEPLPGLVAMLRATITTDPTDRKAQQ